MRMIGRHEYHLAVELKKSRMREAELSKQLSNTVDMLSQVGHSAIPVVQQAEAIESAVRATRDAEGRVAVDDLLDYAQRLRERA